MAAQKLCFKYYPKVTVPCNKRHHLESTSSLIQIHECQFFSEDYDKGNYFRKLWFPPIHSEKGTYTLDDFIHAVKLQNIMIHKPHSVDQIMRQLVFPYVLFGRIYILGHKSKMFTTYHHNDYKSFIFHLRKFHVYYNEVAESYYLTKIIDTNKLSIDYCNCSFCVYYFRENYHKLNRTFLFQLGIPTFIECLHLWADYTHNRPYLLGSLLNYKSPHNNTLTVSQLGYTNVFP